ncbi:avidin/streptavidin family protein [Pacificoceanicola onchidii]|uniref:avidin/streptavidin family protein n=1 Tax=Pacificoceanicola onchidii TaxID=2562685 RepID=UPI0010A3B7A7|nr:avidin/streptavidin family protein [Pacificoceanicola onchidii]
MSAVANAIDGVWYNVYNSKMTLASDPQTGMILGTYASTTGSSGTYQVLGYTQPSSAAPVAGSDGFTVSLNIGWHSLDGGQGDPSWSCVSGLAGQYVMDADGNTVLNLIHQFVAPNPVPLGGTQQFQTGISSDKLVYTRTPPGAADSGAETQPCKPDLADVPAQTWTCTEDPSISFTQNQPFEGLFGGSYTANGVTSSLLGQYDKAYPGDGALYQSYTLSTLNTDPTTGNPETITLAGWIDPASGALKVLEMRSCGTTWAARYAGVRTRGLTFTPG